MPFEITWNNTASAVLWCGARLCPGPARFSLSGLHVCCLRWSLKCTLLRGCPLVRGPQMHFPGGLDVRLPQPGVRFILRVEALLYPAVCCVFALSEHPC